MENDNSNKDVGGNQLTKKVKYIFWILLVLILVGNNPSKQKHQDLINYELRKEIDGYVKNNLGDWGWFNDIRDGVRYLTNSISSTQFKFKVKKRTNFFLFSIGTVVIEENRLLGIDEEIIGYSLGGIFGVHFLRKENSRLLRSLE